MLKLLGIKPSSHSDKKVMAIFYNTETRAVKRVHFGQQGAQDYTTLPENIRDARKELYIKRHRKREEKYWDNTPDKAGTLSRWILWNLPNFKDSVRDYKKRFNF